MHRMFVTAVVAVLFASPVLVGCNTGIGKGSPTTSSTKTTTNPCKPGDTYDAATGLCTGTDGKTYKPNSQ